MSSMLISQLVAMTPTVIVLIVGLILSLAFWGRWPRPAMLTFIAILLYLIATVAYPFLQNHLFASRTRNGWSMRQYTQTVTLVTSLFGLLRAVALALLVSAVFTGRSDREPQGYPVVQSPPPLPEQYR